MLNKMRIAAALASVLAVSLLVLACNGDDENGNGDAVAEVEEIARALAQAGPDDIEFFLAHVTDNLLENSYQTTREECRADAEQCVFGAPSATADNTSIDGDRASTDVTIGGEHPLRLILVREDGVWKVDEFDTVPLEIPEGVRAVDLEMGEFYFDFDESQVRDGNFGFVTNNVGDQLHQVIVERVPEDADIEAVLEAGEPDVYPFISGSWRPGEEGTLVFAEPLEPGRYVLLCFIPDEDDPEGTSHALLGMWAEFTVE